MALGALSARSVPFNSICIGLGMVVSECHDIPVAAFVKVLWVVHTTLNN